MSNKHFFNRYHQYLKNPESTISARNQLLDTCLVLLKENERTPRQLLDAVFIDILIDSSKSVTFDPDKASTALCHIEEYVELLYRYPWKREFWTIKHHCGFYRTMINPWLKRTEEIFKKIGYRIVNGNCFQLQNVPDPDMLVNIGAQCLLASAECGLLSEACRFADSTNYMQTLVLHLDNGGTSKDIVAKLRMTNEHMFIDPNKDLHISDLPLDYSGIDLRYNSHLLKTHPKSLQNFGHTYSSGHPLANLSGIYLPQRTYTEEQQAALDSYRRPLASKQTQFQPFFCKPDLFRGMPGTVASPAASTVPIITADGSNSESDSAYGGSLYGGVPDGQPYPHRILSQTLRRPREPTEHSLEKTADEEESSPVERTLTPTHLTTSVPEGEADTQLAATFSSLPLSSSSSSSSSTSSSSPTSWICKACNYSNLTENGACKICSQIRSRDTPSPPSQPLQLRNSERICEKCTLKNKVTARKCTACGQNFKGYHTAV